jgi:uncharacterized phage protein gp47/JayE
MIKIDENGMTIDSLADILDELTALYRSIYGQDINLNQDSPDGQRLGIEAKARADLQEAALMIYNSFDPDKAHGDALRRIAKLAGIAQKSGSRSMWELKITTDRPLTIPEGWTVESSSNVWRTVTPYPLTGPGAFVVSFFSQEFGNVPGAAGAQIDIISPILGVVDVIAVQPAVPGAAGEKETDFRRRRWQSVQKPSHSTIGGLTAKLLDLPGVTDAIVYENPFPVTQGGLPPHSIRVVIEGGDRADIAKTIAIEKTAGALTVGAEVGTFIEQIQRPGGNGTIDMIHEMHFDRPTITPLWVFCLADRKTHDDPVDITAITEAIEAVTFKIGADVEASQLYQYGHATGTNFVLSNMQVSSDEGATWTQRGLKPARGAKFVIAAVLVSEVV